MKSIQKIAIIGAPGTGKSTLASYLQKQTNLPIFHLDQYFWSPNWTHPEEETYKKIHDKIHNKNKWIIDGMNLKYLESRIIKADLIIFLDYSSTVYIRRIFKRLFQYYGTPSPYSAPGCNEKFNFKFLKFLWWVIRFKKNYLPNIYQLIKQYQNDKEIIIIKTPSQLEKFLHRLKL